MKLQIASRLAIFAILELAAAPNRQHSVVEISEKFGVSPHHLAKVMHALGRADMVRSVRGVGGGYQFSGSVRRTTLLDIVQLFEDISDGSGRDRPAEATAAGLALRQVLDEIDDIARATLGSITIATMLNLIERQRSAGATAGAGVAASA